MLKSELDERQVVLRRRLDEKKKVEAKWSVVRRQVDEHEVRRGELEALLTEEQRELYAMDRFSFRNLLHKWQGTHNEVRRKEEEDVAVVELKLVEHGRMLDDLRAEKVRLEGLLGSYGNVEREWDEFLKEKERWIRMYDPERSREVELHLTYYADLCALKQEIDEAVTAGGQAVSALREAEGHLRSAHSMSTWDTFLGGGLIATSLKHGELDKSEGALHTAQRCLRRFEAELSDVKDSGVEGLRVERDSFVTFADYVFDDIFSEWSIHSKIGSSRENVQAVIGRVSEAVERLVRQREDVVRKRDEAWGLYLSCVSGE